METSGRAHRIATRTRHPRWKPAPVRIDRTTCVNCDLCMRACPSALGAVVRRRFGVVIIPELCNGCGKCVGACPVYCIDDDPDWVPAPAEWWADLRRAAHV